MLAHGTQIQSAWDTFTHAADAVIHSPDSTTRSVATALRENAGASLSLDKSPNLLAATLAAKKLGEFGNGANSSLDYSALCDAVTAAFSGKLPGGVDGAIAALKPQPPKVELAKMVVTPPPVQQAEIKTAPVLKRLTPSRSLTFKLH